MGIDCIFYLECKDETQAGQTVLMIVDKLNNNPSCMYGVGGCPEYKFNTNNQTKFWRLPSIEAYCNLSSKQQYVIISSGCRYHLNQLQYQYKTLVFLDSLIEGRTSNVIRDLGPMPWATVEENASYLNDSYYSKEVQINAPKNAAFFKTKRDAIERFRLKYKKDDDHSPCFFGIKEECSQEEQLEIEANAEVEEEENVCSFPEDQYSWYNKDCVYIVWFDGSILDDVF